MKIVFNKLQTSKETIQVSFDGGTTWNSYIVSEIINEGIPLDENQQYDKIQIKGSSTVLKNLDVVKSIEIPESNDTKDEMFTHVGTSFYGDLVNVKIPESFTSIGSCAFQSCLNLKSVDLPESLTEIGTNAFYNCSNLTSINIPDGVTSIRNNAFYYCTGLTSINIPKGVTEIDSWAFNGCSSLTSIDFPENLTSIGSKAFSGCTSLTSITLPEGLTSISSYAFQDCTSLTSINLPESLTSIGQYAFQSCTSLKTINFKGTEEQWNAISKRDSWNSNCPSDMVINYQGE